MSKAEKMVDELLEAAGVVSQGTSDWEFEKTKKKVKAGAKKLIANFSMGGLPFPTVPNGAHTP